MNTEHAEQSQILTIGKTPAQWVEIMVGQAMKPSRKSVRLRRQPQG